MVERIPIIIDSTIFILPRINNSDQEVDEYITILTDLNLLRQTNYCDFYIREDLQDILSNESIYPNPSNIASFIHNNNIDDLDIKSISRLFSDIYSISNYLEDIVPKDYNDYAYVLSNYVSIYPNITTFISNTSIKTCFIQTVSLLALINSDMQLNLPQHLLYANLKAGTNYVITKNYDIRPDFDFSLLLSDFYLDRFNKFTSGSVIICNSFKTVLKYLDSDKFLVSSLINSDNNSDFEDAIRLILYKSALNHGKEILLHDIILPKFDPKFRETCKAFCLQGDLVTSMLIKAIDDTVNHLNLKHAHPLRTGKGGGDPQIVRISAIDPNKLDKAFRRKLNDGNRLHYWLCYNGNIEFISISVHDYFKI